MNKIYSIISKKFQFSSRKSKQIIWLLNISSKWIFKNVSFRIKNLNLSFRVFFNNVVFGSFYFITMMKILFSCCATSSMHISTEKFNCLGRNLFWQFMEIFIEEDINKVIFTEVAQISHDHLKNSNNNRTFQQNVRKKLIKKSYKFNIG